MWTSSSSPYSLSSNTSRYCYSLCRKDNSKYHLCISLHVNSYCSINPSATGISAVISPLSCIFPFLEITSIYFFSYYTKFKLVLLCDYITSHISYHRQHNILRCKAQAEHVKMWSVTDLSGYFWSSKYDHDHSPV